MRQGEKRIESHYIYFISGILFTLIIFSRLLFLGERPFHHDEAIHGWFSLRIAEGWIYSYDPAYHGPFLFHTLALLLKLFPPSNTLARIIPALIGIGLVFTPLLFRQWLGKREIYLTILLLSISPSILYYSRFFRNDIPVLCFMTIALWGALWYAHTSRSLFILLSGLSVGLSLASKENTYIYLFIFFIYLGIFLIIDRQKWVILKKRTPWILWGTGIILPVILLYTSLFRNPSGLIHLMDSIPHWLEQHRIQRIGGPFWFYLFRIITYEPYLIIGVAGAIGYLIRRYRDLRGFLSLWFLTSLILYSYLQEKVPWLMVHIIFPGTFVTACCLVDIYQNSNKVIRYTLMPLIIIIFTYTLFSSYRVTYTTYDKPFEALTYMQTPRELIEAVDSVKNDPIFVQLKVSWPLVWYFKTSQKTPHYTEDLKKWQAYRYILSDREDLKALQLSEEFIKETYVLRHWWLIDLSQLTWKKAVDFILFRKPFSETGKYWITFARKCNP